MKQKALITGFALGVFIGLWHLGSMVRPTMFPPPTTVFSLALEVLSEPDHRGRTGLDHLQVTVFRIAIITLIVLIISVTFGILMGTRPGFEAPLATVLPVWLAFPSLVVIIFVLILFNFSSTAVYVAVSFVAIPYGIQNTYQAASDVNNNLLEMASVFNMDTLAVWRYIYIPALIPYLFASGRYLLGMIWKIVLFCEAMGVSTGVGTMIRFWYSQGELEIMLAYFILFAVIVLMIEYAILAPAERRYFTWRNPN